MGRQTIVNRKRHINKIGKEKSDDDDDGYMYYQCTFEIDQSSIS